MSSLKQIEVFVLAGGKSSRMGQDKGLLLLHNKPMITYLLDELDKLNLPIKIITNSKEYNTLGFETIKDVVAEKGPMGGLLTAFHFTKAAHVFLISCDMPFLTCEIISKMISEVNDDEITVAQIENKLNPLFAVYKASLKCEVEKRIAEGNLKMHEFIQSVNHKLVEMDVYTVHQPYLFANLNTLNDIKKMLNNGGNLNKNNSVWNGCRKN